MSLLIASCFCCMIIMFTPPTTSVRTAVVERPRGAALSRSFLAALLLSCYCTQAADVVCFALFLLYALPEQQAISFCLFFVLVAAVMLIVVQFVEFAAQRHSLYNCFVSVLGCAVLFLYILWCCQPGGTRREITEVIMQCVQNNTVCIQTVCMLFPFERNHRQTAIKSKLVLF